MKKLKIYLGYVAVFALLLTGCTKDEPVSISDPGETVGLTFGALLNDMSRSQALSRDQHQNEIPGCSDADPAYVWVALQDADDNWLDGKNGDNSEFIEIGVMPDGSGGWMTEESSVLELSAGMYELHYFLVFDGADNLLWVAPREGDTYEDGNFANFVSDPLPMDIDLRVGVKKYVDVEVLCYDENMADAYGYLFFEILDIDTITFCAFGNYCIESGRHFPARFGIQAWMYSGDPNDPKGMLLSNGMVINETGVYDTGDAYALQECIALPDFEGLDQYYIEITILDFEGVYDVEEGVIRELILTDAQVIDLMDNDTFYHFREGTNCGDDTPPFEEPTCTGPDSDQDGVPDACDQCIDIPGFPNEDPLLNGCPQDDECPGSDGDGDGWFGDCDCDGNTNFDLDNDCDEEPGVGECDQTAYMQGNIRFSEIDGGQSNNWGWILDFNIDGNITTIVNNIYAGASTSYNLNDQTNIGTVTAEFNDTTNELTLTFDFDSSVQELDIVHVDISEVNRTQFNPGGYSEDEMVTVGDGDVLTYSYENVDSSFKLIVHGEGACKDAAQ